MESQTTAVFGKPDDGNLLIFLSLRELDGYVVMEKKPSCILFDNSLTTASFKNLNIVFIKGS